MSWERMTVYTLTCDREPCEGQFRERANEDFLPPAGTGLRGARKDAHAVGWTHDGYLDADICPACSKAEVAVSTGTRAKRQI